MNRQTSVTLLVVLIAFCFSMTTAQEAKLSDKQQKEVQELVKKFIEKVQGTFTREEIAELGRLGDKQEQLIQKALEFLKKKTPEQRKKVMEEIDLFESGMDPEVRKYYKPTLDAIRKEMERMDEKKGAKMITTFGSIAIVAALTVF